MVYHIEIMEEVQMVYHIEIMLITKVVWKINGKCVDFMGNI